MMHISTYNVRTLTAEDKLLELEEELSNINWDIVGLSEVRRIGENTIQLRSQRMLYYKWHDSKIINGVGFLINIKWGDKVIKYAGLSVRVACILVQLTQNKALKIIKVYALTETYSDELVDEFYERIQESRDKERCRLTMIIGDLDAKVSSQWDEREIAIGEHGFGIRNERGQMLVNFLANNKLYALHSSKRILSKSGLGEVQTSNIKMKLTS